MSDLTEFLLARIAEDEADASALHDIGSCDLVAHGIIDPGFGWECTCGNPARVLAECEAKRRIVEWSEGWEGDDDPAAHTLAGMPMLLAEVYADHPDYDEAWRP